MSEEAKGVEQTEPTSEKQPKEEEKLSGEGDAKAEGGAAQTAPGDEAEHVEEKPQLSDPEESEDDVPIALVTGASGYLASHIVKQLLEQGRFRVRGTVRSLENDKKVKPLRDLVAEPKYPLRLIEADLLKPKSWTEAVRRCSYVFHVASPLANVKVKKIDDVLKPAVEGTTNVLKACSEAGTVKRVVLTSSIAAVVSLSGDPEKPKDYVYTEEDWANDAVCSTYEKSKLRAERAAWDFVKGLDVRKQFELVTVCPGLVEGPIFSLSHKEGSVIVAFNILSNKLPRIPDVHFLVVDVRDTAAAHIAALEKPEAAGNRYIIVNERLPMKEIAQILATEFKPQGYKISTKGMPKAAMWAAKFVNSDAKMMYPMLGKQITMSNEKMKGELGIEPRPVRDTLIDTGYSIIEMGLVQKKPGYLGHPSTRPPPEEKEEGAAAAVTTEPATKEAKVPSSEEVGEQPPSQQEQQHTRESAETQESPSEPTKAEEPASEPTKDEPAKEEPRSKPEREEEPSSEPAKEEPPSSEPTKEEPPPSEPAKEEEPPPSEPAKEEEPQPSEPAKEEEPQPSEPAKEEPPPSKPAKEEEPPPTEPAEEEEPPREPAKEEEPPSEPAKEEGPPSEPAKEEEPPSEPAKEEGPPSEPAKEEEPPSEPAKEEEPPSEPVKEEALPTEPQVQDKEPPSEPATDDEPLSKPVQEEEPPSKPTNEEPSTQEEVPAESSKSVDTDS